MLRVVPRDPREALERAFARVRKNRRRFAPVSSYRGSGATRGRKIGSGTKPPFGSIRRRPPNGRSEEYDQPMARLSAKRRRKLPKRSFGIPSKRKYPMHDRKHAANAKARATQQYKKGRISKSQRDRIHAKANRKLNRKRKRRRGAKKRRR